jgi:hypothetical protein
VVVLERDPPAVGLVAVELDGEVVLRPVSIDLVAGDADVDRRLGEARAAAEAQEHAFKLLAGVDRGGLVGGKDGT